MTYADFKTYLALASLDELETDRAELEEIAFGIQNELDFANLTRDFANEDSRRAVLELEDRLESCEETIDQITAEIHKRGCDDLPF